jgi:hypothetical protein
MFRRAWWTRRRIVVAAVLAVLVVIIWSASRTEWVYEGQSLEEAKASLQRAGAVELQNESFGFFFSVSAARVIPIPASERTEGGPTVRYVGPSGEEVTTPDRVDSCWEFPDGRTLRLIGFRKSSDTQYQVQSFGMWQGWPKRGDSKSNQLPTTSIIPLFRSPW